jgi:hypothetical protein
MIFIMKAITPYVPAALALAFAILLVAWRFSGDPWENAATQIQAEATKDALIVIAPAMHNREVRRFDGYAVVAVNRLSHRDTRGYDEVWILSEGAPKDTLLRGLSQFKSEHGEEIDGLVLTRFERTKGGS